MHAFFELHIEQGPILEAEGKDIGVVTHGQGLRWIECTVTGKESHTGSTPMHMRKNAGRGLALITELVHEIAMKNQPNAVGAIGHIDVYPNSRNIIPGKVVFTVDMRTHLLDKLNGDGGRVHGPRARLCEEIGVGSRPRSWASSTRPPSTRTASAPSAKPLKGLGYSHMDIVSGAGHDACWINDVAPTAMVMCPCVDGLSHNEAEEISPEWATAGADVLFHAVVETAEIVE
jgi:N-carbamoyl-L-amino-acid hydrolase